MVYLTTTIDIIDSLFQSKRCDISTELRLESLALAFNGGKDGLVLLHICRLILKNQNMNLKKLVVFNIVLPDSLEDVDLFAAKEASE